MTDLGRSGILRRSKYFYTLKVYGNFLPAVELAMKACPRMGLQMTVLMSLTNIASRIWNSTGARATRRDPSTHLTTRGAPIFIVVVFWPWLSSFLVPTWFELGIFFLGLKCVF